MEIQLTGTMHGRTIELDTAPELADGQRVEVTVVALAAQAPWGEGLRQAAGVMASDPDFERIMAEVQEMRRLRDPRRLLSTMLRSS